LGKPGARYEKSELEEDGGNVADNKKNKHIEFGAARGHAKLVKGEAVNSGGGNYEGNNILA